jgi:hypothetical protein
MDSFVDRQVRFMLGDFYGVAEVDPPPLSELLPTKNGKTGVISHIRFMEEAKKRCWSRAYIVSSEYDEHYDKNVFLISHSRLYGHRGNPLFPFSTSIPLGHCMFVFDTTAFCNKKDIFFWRGSTTGYSGMENIKNNLRYKFVSELFNVPNIDIGFSGFCQDVYEKWSKEYLNYAKEYVSIKEQTANKFILCLEGNTFPSNLGWALSSNSCPVIVYPFEFECYIHGQGLIPWQHFIPVKRDLTDFFEIMEWCFKDENQQKCEEIAKAGKIYMAPYNDPLLYREIIDTFFDMLPWIRGGI